MADLTWSVVEEALLAALEAELGDRVQTVASYQGKWLEDLQSRAWRLPAVLGMLGRSRGEQGSMRSWDLILDFIVLVALRPLRGEASTRLQEGGISRIWEGGRG